MSEHILHVGYNVYFNAYCRKREFSNTTLNVIPSQSCSNKHDNCARSKKTDDDGKFYIIVYTLHTIKH